MIRLSVVIPVFNEKILFRANRVIYKYPYWQVSDFSGMRIFNLK